jgi:hypothetical protein
MHAWHVRTPFEAQNVTHAMWTWTTGASSLHVMCFLEIECTCMYVDGQCNVGSTTIIFNVNTLYM